MKLGADRRFFVERAAYVRMQCPRTLFGLQWRHEHFSARG